jgi:phage FluMu protein Com
MIKFDCKNCGQRIAACEAQAGKKGRCPKCKAILVVPADFKLEFETERTQTSPQEIAELEDKLEKPGLNLTFLDSPQKDRAGEKPVVSDSITDRRSHELQSLEERLATAAESEPVGQRKFPWFIDIFLYPISAPAVIIIGIVISIPLLIGLVAYLLGPFGFFVSIPGFFINIVVGLYMYWYLCHCVRDSAEGNIRAPDVLVSSPTIGDMFFQTLKVVICLLFFSAPMLIYYYTTGSTDFIFWLLFGFAVLFFPMGFLAVIMFDSINGLNPILLIGSIFSTFFQYLGLLFLFSILGWLIVRIFSVTSTSLILNLLLPLAIIYLSLVTAHLLGRFYWRNQERLRWGI